MNENLKKGQIKYMYVYISCILILLIIYNYYVNYQDNLIFLWGNQPRNTIVSCNNKIISVQNISNPFHDENSDNQEAFVTFIIPSIGRETLKRTINSLLNQTNNNWNAIIIFDGVAPTIKLYDYRIRIIETTKKIGTGKNSAGSVRNIGMKEVTTKWLGFVDDDDVLHPKYVEYLISHNNDHPEIGVVIFRMNNSDGRILPLHEEDNFHLHNVGISFSIKTKIVKEKEIYFIPSWKEDFMYLSAIRDIGIPIMISPHIAYYVRKDITTLCINENIANEVLIIDKFCKRIHHDQIKSLGKITTLYCFWTGSNPMTQNRYECFQTLVKTKLDVVLITMENLHLFISKRNPLHPAFQYLSAVHQSDYLRCYFMHIYGGVYCDIKRINHSLVDYVKILKSNDRKYGIGYAEIKNGNATSPDWSESYNNKLTTNYNKLIGCGCFIFKRNTIFTHKWFTALNNKLSNKFNLLKQYPANSPTCAADRGTYQYPFRYIELLGEIFHPLCFEYHDALLNTLPPPSFINYH